MKEMDTVKTQIVLVRISPKLSTGILVKLPYVMKIPLSVSVILNSGASCGSFPRQFWVILSPCPCQGSQSVSKLV